MAGTFGVAWLGFVLAMSAGSAAAQEGRPTAAPAAAGQPGSGERESVEPRFLRNIRQVTEGFEKAGEGYFSPDGKTIVYQAVKDKYPFYQIYTQPLAGGEPQLISSGRGRTTCAYFSPDGEKILFASSHLDPMLSETEQTELRQLEEDRRNNVRRRYRWDFDPHMDIFALDRQSGKLDRLTREYGYDAEGAYSRDGSQIAFCSMRDGDAEIYIMNADGSDVRRLTHAKGYCGGPFISPDGRWVIFRSDRDKPEMLQLFVIGVDGKNETKLTDNEGVNWGPYWHPSEPYIIWSGADHSDPEARPNYDLWLARYQVEGGKFSLGEPIRITDSPAADVLPVFSPDGKRLMWTSTRTADRTSQLFIADFELPQE